MLTSPFMLFFLSVSVSFGLGVLVIFWPIRDRQLLAWPSLILAIIGSAAAIVWAIIFWSHPTSRGETLFSSPQLFAELPALSWEFYIDRLTALFLLLVGGGSLVVSIYSFAYLGLVSIGTGKPENDAHGIAAAYNLFVGTMLLAITANNVFSLLLCLEVMSLAFGYLVLFRHNKGRDMAGTQWLPEDRRTRKLAIQAYLISSHVSLVFVMTGLLLRASQSDSFSFDTFRHLGITADPLTFGLIFVGLAIRAGVVPFHIWIPLAHPSSPTNTHALSLGVAIKVPIYLMIRVFFGLLGPIPGWWGPVVLVFAALTAVVGTFYAMASRDLKTALSYSSIENVGIILVGVGLALTLASADLRGAPALLGLASLALVACLYHAVNHALFKGLLYLATGTIEKLTGTVDYRWLGGLIKSIPWSAGAFLVGAVAIAGFPPFNGFISEWLTLQGLFAALSAFSTAGLILPACATVVAIALLALTFGLTAFTFVKIAGTAILGAPRRALVVSQHKVPWFVHVIFAGLGCMCLLLGIFPLPFLGLLAQVTQALGLPGLALTGGASVILINSNAGFAGGAYTVTLNNGLLWLLAAAFVVLVVSVAFRERIRRNTKVPLPVWSSGIRYDSMHMQATGDYFGYQVDVPLRRRRPGVLAGGDMDGAQMILSTPRSPHVRTAEIVPEGLPISDQYQVIEFFQRSYNFCLTSLRRFASWTTLLLQNGRERVYVVYTVITLVALLVVWFMGGGR